MPEIINLRQVTDQLSFCSDDNFGNYCSLLRMLQDHLQTLGLVLTLIKFSIRKFYAETVCRPNLGDWQTIFEFTKTCENILFKRAECLLIL